MADTNKVNKKPFKKRSRDPNWNSESSRRIQNYVQNPNNNASNKVAKKLIPADVPTELKSFILQAKSAEEALDISTMLWKDTTNEDYELFVKAMHEHCMRTEGPIGNEITGIRYVLRTYYSHQEPTIPEFGGLTRRSWSCRIINRTEVILRQIIILYITLIYICMIF